MTLVYITGTRFNSWQTECEDSCPGILITSHVTMINREWAVAVLFFSPTSSYPMTKRQWVAVPFSSARHSNLSHSMTNRLSVPIPFFSETVWSHQVLLPTASSMWQCLICLWCYLIISHQQQVGDNTLLVFLHAAWSHLITNSLWVRVPFLC